MERRTYELEKRLATAERSSKRLWIVIAIVAFFGLFGGVKLWNVAPPTPGNEDWCGTSIGTDLKPSDKALANVEYWYCKLYEQAAPAPTQCSEDEFGLAYAAYHNQFLPGKGIWERLVTSTEHIYLYTYDDIDNSGVKFIGHFYFSTTPDLKIVFGTYRHPGIGSDEIQVISHGEYTSLSALENIRHERFTLLRSPDLLKFSESLQQKRIVWINARDAQRLSKRQKDNEDQEKARAESIDRQQKIRAAEKAEAEKKYPPRSTDDLFNVHQQPITAKDAEDDLKEKLFKKEEPAPVAVVGATKQNQPEPPKVSTKEEIAVQERAAKKRAADEARAKLLEQAKNDQK